MQTFLPYPDYLKSAMSLDRQRLGKQRVEVLQILQALTGNDENGWRHHPAVRMWVNHGRALQLYGLTVCLVWRKAGYEDTCLEKIAAIQIRGEVISPPGFTEEFHLSHRSNLVRKYPEFYVPQFGEVSPMPYVWPEPHV